MAPKIVLQLIADLTHTPIPDFTARAMNIGDFVNKYKMLPTASPEQMQSCEHYLRSWLVVLFLISMILPWRRGENDDANVHQRNKTLLYILCYSGASLIFGMLYHMHLSFIVNVYQQDVLNVTIYDKAVHAWNKVQNGEVFDTLTYGVRDFGVVKQEPVAVYLFFGMVLVFVSWYLLAFPIMSMGNHCRFEFFLVGFVAPLFIVSCFVRHFDICVIALSVVLPYVDFFFDLLFGWLYP
jgi:hypothetical protein